ncbi:M55 family metallopeptidase [Brucella pseudogrignonensis]|jgi:D-amino peptidase|uniref:Peptide ABC transporter n=1 Tax=Brucella pseudogrignonensis TaxID=419475 RepID=A0A7Y3T9Z3_9HYPH|nr:M55 family metallopeptidase [Brucella pseudogrignonensis]MBO1027101.1 M55 family metallopeptidase [Ochrobactrum sp. SD129]MCD4512284.1 M55 family metallopeptidase [Brucella pseudogrignonensis]NNV23613.1 peptide ABC transporter [Brucella pseudogrignonensis]
MKLFISADMEGTAGILSWNEAEHSHADYQEFRALMTEEVVAACQGARAAGATQILIKDAHDSGRNLMLDRLPDYTQIVRGWSGHPDSMMFGLDESFSGAFYIGYHAKAGTEANPLAHTFNLRISRLILNDAVVSEFTINALCAARYKVPSLLVSGDAGICHDANDLVSGIATVQTLTGYGAAALSMAPAAARAAIAAAAQAAVENIAAIQPPVIAKQFRLIIEFNNPCDAYRASFYPNACSNGPRSVLFETTDYFEILRALRFMKS